MAVSKIPLSLCRNYGSFIQSFTTMTKDINNLTPAKVDEINQDALDYYNLVLRKWGQPSNMDTFTQAQKHAVQKAGYDYEEFAEWCKNNLDYEDWNDDEDY